MPCVNLKDKHYILFSQKVRIKTRMPFNTTVILTRQPNTQISLDEDEDTQDKLLFETSQASQLHTMNVNRKNKMISRVEQQKINTFKVKEFLCNNNGIPH